MSGPLKDSAQCVQNRLSELGYTNEVVELAHYARTAQEAADAIGCDVAQIAKSIIFRLEDKNLPLLVVASGANRINETKLSLHLHERIGKADAGFVLEHTGFAIGGIPPLGHRKSLTTIVDEDLFRFPTIWAAAGHPQALFALTPQQLVEMTQGQVMTVK
ncbi:MAG TPA: hypothetical protein DD856_08120 [Sulfobacillus sp.]|nr:hypothetical protein [Sulfobacillus sp.]